MMMMMMRNIVVNTEQNTGLSVLFAFLFKIYRNINETPNFKSCHFLNSLNVLYFQACKPVDLNLFSCVEDW